MAKPTPPKLPHPSTGDRIPFGGSPDRDRPVFQMMGGSDEKSSWEVKVTPLVGAGGMVDGARLGGGRQKPRAVFEVRAEYRGTGLAEFGSVPNTKMIEMINEEDEERAIAIARASAELLRAGKRDDFDINVVSQRLRGHKIG